MMNKVEKLISLIEEKMEYNMYGDMSYKQIVSLLRLIK